jgi:hypothetical protein
LRSDPPPMSRIQGLGWFIGLSIRAELTPRRPIGVNRAMGEEAP